MNLKYFSKKFNIKNFEMKTTFVILRSLISLLAGIYLIYLAFEHKSEENILWFMLIVFSINCFTDFTIQIKRSFKEKRKYNEHK
jgi:dolichol kinase